MRKASPHKLLLGVKDFLDSVQNPPRWIESSASDRPGRGHYEWGNWGDYIRSESMWKMGGPWRVIVYDLRDLLTSPANFHRIKDQIVWEIVEQAYNRAERARNSMAPSDTVKTRIRSVFSWQRRHDVKKNSLMWFLDFAFANAAYAEFQAKLLFSTSAIPQQDFAEKASLMEPAEFGRQAVRMDEVMTGHGFLPFYCQVPGLSIEDVLASRELAREFCESLTPPVVDMDTTFRETRGMPREEKAADFMTPWLQEMSSSEYDGKWTRLVCRILDERHTVKDFDLFKTEICRASVTLLLMDLTKNDSRETGYVYDIAPNIAVEQSEKELLVSQRMRGQKRKRTVSRRTLRGDLEFRIQQYEAMSDNFNEYGSPSRYV